MVLLFFGDVMKKLVLVLCLGQFAGCASVIKGSSDTVNVNSIEKGTTIYVDGAARGLDSASVSVRTYAKAIEM